MYHWMVSNPEFARYYGIGRSLHAEAVAQGSSLALKGLLDLPASALAIAVRLFRGWQLWRARRRAVGELQVLDDRMLKDIGVSRSEIPALVEATLAAEREAGPAVPVAIAPLRPVASPRSRSAGNDNPLPALARSAHG